MLPFVENEKKFRLRYTAASNVKGKSLLNKKKPKHKFIHER